MARYYFHIINGHGPQTDEAGQEFSGPQLAIAAAAGTAGEILRSDIGNSCADQHLELTVANDSQAAIAVITVDLALLPRQS